MQNPQSCKGIAGIKPVTSLKRGSSDLNELLVIYVEIMGIYVKVEALNFQIHLKFSSWSPRSSSALPGLLIHLAYLPTSIICCLDFQKTKRYKNSFL